MPITKSMWVRKGWKRDFINAAQCFVAHHSTPIRPDGFVQVDLTVQPKEPWFPIKDAPRDGTPFIVWDNIACAPTVADIRPNCGLELVVLGDYASASSLSVTHYMPLPKAALTPPPKE